MGRGAICCPFTNTQSAKVSRSQTTQGFHDLNAQPDYLKDLPTESCLLDWVGRGGGYLKPECVICVHSSAVYFAPTCTRRYLEVHMTGFFRVRERCIFLSSLELIVTYATTIIQLKVFDANITKNRRDICSTKLHLLYTNLFFM